MEFIKRNIRGLFLIAAALILIGIGLYRQEAGTVFRKAINICMECIGLG